MRSVSACHLYGILDLGYVTEPDLERVTSSMLEGGVDILQLRAKGCPPDAIAAMAQRILPSCRDAGTPLIINDHPEVALQVGADGVHVGQDDRSVADVREQVGPDFLVGKSTHSLTQARAASQEAVDYIGFGPLFATPTKPDYPAIGLEDIQTVHEELSLPIFCIGGIKRENAETVLHAGAKRLVIVSGILQAADIPGYIQDVRRMLPY